MRRIWNKSGRLKQIEIRRCNEEPPLIVLGLQIKGYQLRKKKGTSSKSKQNVSLPKLPILPKCKSYALSDYEAFMEKSKKNNEVDYPSAFKFIRIISAEEQDISRADLHEICPLSHSKEQLVVIATELIRRVSSNSCFVEPNLKLLIRKISQKYNAVAYHNFSHGFSLMQCLYRCLHGDAKFCGAYSDEEKFFTLLAALAHDINHKGTNNGFEVKLKTELALTAQNEAVLQKMHIRTFLELMQSSMTLNALNRSKNPEYNRKVIVRMILATDMAQHFPNLSKLQKMRQSSQLDFCVEDKRIFFMEQVFHASDIGNPCSEFEEYLNWASLLTYQFNEQTKLEAANGVPVTEFLRFTGIDGFLKDQNGFITTFVQPLWKQINQTLPKTKIYIQNIENNLQKLKTLKDEQKA